MFLASAAGALLVVFAGFARTYYLKGAFGAPALPAHVHLHGVVMSSWFLLFLVQVVLVATRRTGAHRKLGVAGACLAATMVILGLETAIVATRRDLAGPVGAAAIAFVAVPFFDMLVFGGLVTAGIALRKRLAAHKRLMLVASMSLLPAAIARIPVPFGSMDTPLMFFGLTDVLILAAAAFDTVRNRKLHPAFLWGTLVVVASQVLRLWLSETEIWRQFAMWLVG